LQKILQILFSWLQRCSTVASLASTPSMHACGL
jgi:hypothetical protein